MPKQTAADETTPTITVKGKLEEIKQLLTGADELNMIHFEPTGKKRDLCVILFPGNGASSLDLEPLIIPYITDLTKRGITVVAIEYPGCGFNRNNPNQNYVKQQKTEDIVKKAIMLMKEAGFSKYRLIGRSLGAMASTVVIADHLDKLATAGINIDKILYLAPLFKPVTVSGRLIAQMLKIEKFAKNHPTLYEFIRKIVILLPQNNRYPRSAVNESDKYLPLMFDNANFKGVKTLWVQGGDDKTIEIDYSGFEHASKDNKIKVNLGTHNLDTPPEKAQYYNETIKFLIS